ncbi:MAG: adenylate kinase [Candidatus Nanoarchaeia archaeon]
MKLVIMGPQGSGKGTQAQKLSRELNIPHISTGDIFRENIKNSTELGRQAKEYIDNGELVPDRLTIKIVLDRLTWRDCEKGFILDGFPRNTTQAKALDEKIDIDYAILVDISDEVAVDRISSRKTCDSCGLIYAKTNETKCSKCGGTLYIRDDDTPETVKKRLQVYHENTKPVINHYDEKNNLMRINGENDIESVFLEIKRKIKI